ncbi:5338_t:CDS:1, partial [Ambispora leptoticha]
TEKVDASTTTCTSAQIPQLPRNNSNIETTTLSPPPLHPKGPRKEKISVPSNTRAVPSIPAQPVFQMEFENVEAAQLYIMNRKPTFDEEVFMPTPSAPHWKQFDS